MSHRPAIAAIDRMAAMPGPREPALGRAVAVLHDLFDVDRVSVARIDSSAGTFEILAEAGRSLLSPGTVLPLDTCSYFVGAPDGRAFGDEDFAASRTFRLPLDGVILAAGYHAGCSVPIHDDGGTIGALSLSTATRRGGMTRLVGELEPVAEALGRLRAAGGGPAAAVAAHLTTRERQLLRLLDEGLRFKQIARLLAISESTAKTHGRNLFRKLGASSRSEAVHVAREAGLLV